MGRIALGAHDGPLVLIAALGQRQIRGPAIGVDRRPGLDSAAHEPVLRNIRHRLHAHAPETLGIPDLNRDRHDRLAARLAADDALLDTADVGLIDLDVSAEPVAAGAHHRHAEAVQHRPGGLVGAQPERALDAQRETPCFWLVISHAASNHGRSGVRVLSKIVPAVPDACRPQTEHSNRPTPNRHPCRLAHRAQRNPSGQRSHSR